MQVCTLVTSLKNTRKQMKATRELLERINQVTKDIVDYAPDMYESNYDDLFYTEERIQEAIEEEENVTFPWFTVDPQDADLVEAYSRFVCAICDLARKQKKVTSKEKPVVNEKYAFRCFLLRLGFIGEDYKNVRKVLLKNLTGNAAWKEVKSKNGQEG